MTRPFLILAVSMLFFKYGYSQREGVFTFSREDLTSNSNDSNKIWFKDSTAIYELRIHSQSRIETSKGTIFKNSYRVWKYTYLDLRTMVCQDYQTFSETAKPICNYYIKPDDTLEFSTFFSSPPKWFNDQKMIKLSDTIIDGIVLKRMKTFYRYYPQVNYYTITYLKCNVPQNIFNTSSPFDKIYKGCKAVMDHFFDSTGNVLFINKAGISNEKLSIKEKNIFKQWQRNSLNTKIPLLSYNDARKNCEIWLPDELPTIVAPYKKKLPLTPPQTKPSSHHPNRHYN